MDRANRLRASLLAIVGVAAAAFLCWITLIRNTIDFTVYLAGGQALAHGSALYDVDIRTPEFDLPFTYPPFAAATMIPLSLLPRPVALAIWTTIAIASLWGIAYLTARRLPRLAGVTGTWRSWEIAVVIFGVSALSEPITENFKLGQANLLVVVAVLFDTLARSRATGLLTGLAAGFKVTPGLFIIFMLVGRRWADALRAGAGFAITLTVGAAFGLGQLWSFWTDQLFSISRVGDTTRISNMSLQGMLARILPAGPADYLWLLGSAVAAVACLWLAYRWWTSSRLVSAATIGLGTLLISPISWLHHWVWLIPAVAACAALAVRAFRAGRRGIGTAQVVAITLTVLPTLTHIRATAVTEAVTGDFGKAIVGATYPVAAIALLAAFAAAQPLRSGLPPQDEQQLASPPGLPAGAR